MVSPPEISCFSYGPGPGGDLLFPWRKRRQNAPGVRSEEHRSGAPSRCTPDPIYRGYPFGCAENFRRAKPGVLECGFFRAHRGPVFAKSAFGAVPLLRLSFLSQRSRFFFRCRGGLWPPADRSGISCEGNWTALYPRRGGACLSRPPCERGLPAKPGGGFC